MRNLLDGTIFGGVVGRGASVSGGVVGIGASVSGGVVGTGAFVAGGLVSGKVYGVNTVVDPGIPIFGPPAWVV